MIVETETFWNLLHNAAHWEFEIFLMLLFDGLVGALLWPFASKHIKHHLLRDRKDLMNQDSTISVNSHTFHHDPVAEKQAEQQRTIDEQFDRIMTDMLSPRYWKRDDWLPTRPGKSVTIFKYDDIVSGYSGTAPAADEFNQSPVIRRSDECLPNLPTHCGCTRTAKKFSKSLLTSI